MNKAKIIDQQNEKGNDMSGSIPAASTIVKPSKFRLFMRFFEGSFYFLNMK